SGPTAPPARPGSVSAAFWLWMLVLVMSIASTALLFTGDYLDQVRAALADQPGADLAVALADNVVMIGLVAGVVISAFIYLFFGLKMYTGRNWARIVLTVLGGLSVLSGALGSTT